MNKMETLKQEIEAKKKELKELKKKNKTPFAQTKFGKVYFSFLSTISKPGANLYAYTKNKQAENFQVLLEDSKYWLNEAKETKEPNNDMANKLAKLVMELEAHPEYRYDVEHIGDALHEEIERLRVEPEDTELFNKISELVDEEVKKCSPLQ